MSLISKLPKRNQLPNLSDIAQLFINAFGARNQTQASTLLAEIKQLDIESLTMAVARYMKEHPDVTDMALNWLDSRDVSEWLAMSTTELEVEASQRLKQLKRWEKLARKSPDVWETYQIRSMHIELNLGAAYSGIFLTAMGEFAYFLDVVGASYDELRLF